MTKEFPGEQCAGCGVYAPAHPWAAVMSDDGGKTFQPHPCCAGCWSDPAHRVVPLKASFFPRAQGEEAARMAGERDTAGNPVRS